MRPVADLVVRLQRRDEPPPGRVRGVDRAAVRALTERRPGAVVEERRASSTFVSAPGVGEVGVVALRLAGQRDVQARGGCRRPTGACSPMPPAPPGPGAPPSPGRCGRTRRSASAAGRARRRGRPPASDSSSSRAAPGRRAARARRRAAARRRGSRAATCSALSMTKARTWSLPRSVEVERLAPRGLVAVGEVRPELAEVVAVRAEVVVDDVEADAEPAGVAASTKRCSAVRAAVRLVHRRTGATPS